MIFRFAGLRIIYQVGWMLKASIWDGPPDLEVWGSKNIQIEAFSTPGHGHRILKHLNSKFWDPKTSNWKVLTSWGHLSGWLDANSFDLGWPPGLEVWIPGASQDGKTFEFEVLGSKNVEFEGFNILGPSIRLAGC